MASVGRLRGGIGGIALATWFGVMTLVCAGLLARHVLAMPTPTRTARLAQHLATLRHPGQPKQWLAVHVLDSECKCSQRVANHLVETTRPAGVTEVVLWVGPVAPPPSLGEHFEVRRVTGEELARYEIEAAPLLIAVSPENVVAYAGGYTDRKQGPVFHDLDVLASVMTSHAVTTLPLFGCATSARLRNALSTLPVP